jgi:hypothetical protein
MASYCRNARKYSRLQSYTAARPYYLAFFALVQEDDPLWSRMRGLINPMLSYYWANAGREMNINTTSWNISGASPAQIAVSVATFPDSELQRRWQALTQDLARINPDLLRRIADQIALDRGESPEYAQVADQIKQILEDFAVEKMRE